MNALLEHLRDLELALLTASVRGSVDALDALLANEFVEFGRSGGIYNKAEIIGSLTTEIPGADPPVGTGFALKELAPDVALLTWRSICREPDGREAHSLRSSIWKQTGGRWQIVFHQGTPTPFRPTA